MPVEANPLVPLVAFGFLMAFIVALYFLFKAKNRRG